MLAFVVLTGAQLSSSSLKVVGRERPDLALRVANVSAKGMAFPSGNDTAATAGFVLLALLLGRYAGNRFKRMALWPVAAAAVLVVGWRRFYLWVHWPSDVRAGWLLGGFWAFTGWGLCNDRTADRQRVRAAAAPSGSR